MNTLKILVLEDHPVQQLLALEQLQRLGVVAPLAASDGASALSLLREHGAADIVLCDLHMPGMDGLEFASRVRAQGSTAQLALLTANIQDAIRDKAAALAVQFVRKPVTPVSVAEAMALVGG